ncbi:hypothetical protein H8711_00410 [Clostridiaceae bacterium NSJ-31]|uniref:HlyD family secretion protein n=1 Tax=Ligaoa zhengdingensis TaxID=2763658 RepID=A0A926DWY1_9FIRM|nr:HlyD family efflux transporter periplasmic adaptor subunit [Ligaoa zhengdingensis]MBC8545398.1 hypothetical protein [Ligaoa zhengdingensis]
METLSGKILTALMALFLLIYVGYQGYRYYYSPIKTETVLGYTVQDTLRVKGLLVRDEQPVEGGSSGVVAYFGEDGMKVTYGTPIAEIYATKEDVTNKRRIQSLEEELNQLEAIQKPGNNYFLNSEAISKQINENLYAIIDCNESRDLLESAEDKAELLTNLNKRQLATGAVSNFSSKIDRLEREKSQLEQSVSGGSQVITSDRVGYFSSYVDGMEQELTVDELDVLTVDQVQGYIDGKYEQESSELGKIISFNAWYFVALIPEDEAVTWKEGEKLSIDFSIPDFREVPAVIQSIRVPEGEKQAIVTFQCSYMCPQLTRLRNPSVQLNFGMYTGLKIPDQAVRFVDGERGVYVNTGSEIKFKTIDVIYEGAGFVLSAIDEYNQNQVQWFDDIVVKGTDLQDGKPVDQG